MIKIIITEQDIKQAKKLSEEMGSLKNSITEGDGNICGFIGEIIVANYIGGKHENSYDYDIIGPNGHKIDVKTKRTNFEPKEFYECSIAKLNTRQKCDFYIFTRILNDMSVGWILGCKHKEEYFNQANFMKAGQVDSSNNFTVKSDCYNLRISDLNNINEFLI